MLTSSRACLAILLGLTLGSCTVLIEGRIVDRVEDCANQANGTPCVGGDYCIANDCRYSYCGDGILNRDRGEDCDDANVLPGDGCQPATCSFTCDGQTPCADDGNICNGAESCSASDHLCSSGPYATPGTPCIRTGGAPGLCSQGFCIAPGCGDGNVLGQEQCEPPASGCQPDCTWACDSDSDCPSLDYCDNLRFCDLNVHQCADAPTPNCADSDTCTTEHCDPIIGCVVVDLDTDDDGFVPGMDPCSPGSAYMPGDCDDNNPGVNPAAIEQCNGVDDNCFGGPDENVQNVQCLRDADRDTYGTAEGGYTACTCAEGYVVDVPGRLLDCNDTNESINPAADPTSYHFFPHCPLGGAPSEVNRALDEWKCPNEERASWDWNCDRVVELQYPYTYAETCGVDCAAGGGYTHSVPPCGASGAYEVCIDCEANGLAIIRDQYCR